MEPVHYVRALRRRWWVIAASVLVASAAAWLTTAAVPSAGATVAPPTAYTATTVLWNTGAPTIGQGSPITSMEALAQVVTLPGPTAIAAKALDFHGDPLVLSSKVQGSVDQASGFLNITATAPTREQAVATSTAFSEALLTYLKRLNVRRIDESQRLLLEQINTLQQLGVDPTVIASVRAGLSQLALDRTAPLPITTIQRATAEPVAVEVKAEGGLTAPTSRITRTLLGALIGLLAGIVLALVLERFDTRIRSARAAEEAFGLPVLAEVPAIQRRRRKKLVTVSYPYSRAADAFRLIGVAATRWSSSNGDGDGHPKDAETILVTSPEAGDGKTTVAANLAVALAQSGKRVLVVSCDLRRPAIHESFGVPIQPGLTDALYASNGHRNATEPLDLAPYLEPCSIVRIGVLPSGATPERPGELLGSRNMQTLVERLKKLTDVIILDCAPLVVASDVVPLLPLADGVVLVARGGKTRQELAANAATLLERLGADTAGVVLNHAREFAIPLPKRKVYAPTRKMKKAAANAAAPPWQQATEPQASQPSEVSSMIEEEPPLSEEPPSTPAIDEPHAADKGEGSPVVEVPEPQRGVQIPDVSPTADERGGGGPSLSATEPERNGSPVAQMVAPEPIVVLPEADRSADEETLSSFESLEQQLADFRDLLGAPEIEGGADTSPQPDRWTDVG
jgi:capsular exopolysaccharide synthesis family protein